ncbi:MAG: energy coupling factor transporter S component ThiW [Christensenellaceae bacterium]|jgi:energy coupling factor transporter S component ThiW|nr:energy coupling factor transporter S component ThiW [Christensenellaceae bacterium]
MKKSKLYKLALSGLLVALTVAASPLSIPIGASRCFPVQHLVNVVAAVVLGPGYGVGMALMTSLIRLGLGTGTLLAFPGSMAGALLCGLSYRYTGKLSLTCLAEVFGTGILGALLAYPVATLVMGREAALFGYILPFGVSSLGGALIAALVLIPLRQTGLLGRLAPAHRA